MKLSRTLRTTAITAVAFSTVVALAGCAPASSNTGSGDAPAGDTVKIGYIGALTGGSASLGVPSRNAIQMAIDEINESGDLDRKLELVVIDDEADATKSASGAQRMVEEDGVIAVIGGPNSGTVLAGNPIITEAGVVHLISVAQADGLIDPSSAGHDLTFQVTENNTYDVMATVQFFVDGDYDKICAVSDTTEYGQSGISSIRTVFEGAGLTVAEHVSHEVNATDVTPQVLALRDANCDSVYLYTYGQDAALFMKTVNQVGWDVDVIGGRALNQSAFLSIAGSSADGIIFPSVIDLDKKSAKDFISAYQARFGADDDPAQTFSALSYDSVKILVAGLKASNFEGGQALADALATVTLDDAASGREGSTLSFTFGDHRAPSDNFVTFWTIKDGEFDMYSNEIDSKRP